MGSGDRYPIFGEHVSRGPRKSEIVGLLSDTALVSFYRAYVLSSDHVAVCSGLAATFNPCIWEEVSNVVWWGMYQVTLRDSVCQVTFFRSSELSYH